MTQPKNTKQDSIQCKKLYTPRQMQKLISHVLRKIDLFSQHAEMLMMGTAAIESEFQFRKQIKGQALGLFQMERATFEFLINDLHRDCHRETRDHILTMVHGQPSFSSLRWDDYFATAMARFKYYTVPEAIPADIYKQALYWRKYYNGDSPHGRSDSDYVARWIEYCTGFYGPHILVAGRNVGVSVS